MAPKHTATPAKAQAIPAEKPAQVTTSTGPTPIPVVHFAPAPRVLGPLDTARMVHKDLGVAIVDGRCVNEYLALGWHFQDLSDL